ncbi:hypothetical protein ACFX58_04725 [Sphingomonas sp. NCPPB 2930]
MLSQSARTHEENSFIFCTAGVFLAACDANNHSVKILITPSEYQVGKIKSELATPAVDEVLRQDPKYVLIAACRATSSAKTIQFQMELAARYSGKMQMTFTDEGCPNA